jgi:hypothetical protein
MTRQRDDRRFCVPFVKVFVGVRNHEVGRGLRGLVAEVEDADAPLGSGAMVGATCEHELRSITQSAGVL